MTIKKEIKKLIWLINDEKNLPIKEKEFKAIVRKKKFPNNKIKNISNLLDSKKGDITFFENVKYPKKC